MYVLRLGSFFQRHLMTCYFRHVQIIHSCQIRLERTQNDTNISSSRHPDAGVVHNNLDVIRRKFKMNCVTVIFRSVDSIFSKPKRGLESEIRSFQSENCFRLKWYRCDNNLSHLLPSQTINSRIANYCFLTSV